MNRKYSNHSVGLKRIRVNRIFYTTISNTQGDKVRSSGRNPIGWVDGVNVVVFRWLDLFVEEVRYVQMYFIACAFSLGIVMIMYLQAFIHVQHSLFYSLDLALMLW